MNIIDQVECSPQKGRKKNQYLTRLARSISNGIGQPVISSEMPFFQFDFSCVLFIFFPCSRSYVLNALWRTCNNIFFLKAMNQYSGNPFEWSVRIEQFWLDFLYFFASPPPHFLLSWIVKESLEAAKKKKYI